MGSERLAVGNGGEFVHVSNSFEFIAEASVADVTPLFGARREAEWLSGWDPQFVYPTPARDVPGAVFTVRHGNMEGTWVMTEFDLEGGHIQYVATIPKVMLSVINVQLRSGGANMSHVLVRYDRTSLDPSMSEHVRERGKADLESGPEWGEHLNSFLRKRGS
jgi:hypothetical protein